jgi:hypothetical protein
MKKTNFGKFTIYGNISMEIGIMGKFPWIYGTMPSVGGRQVKITPTFSGHGGQGGRGLAC